MINSNEMQLKTEYYVLFLSLIQRGALYKYMYVSE